MHRYGSWMICYLGRGWFVSQVRINIILWARILSLWRPSFQTKPTAMLHGFVIKSMHFVAQNVFWLWKDSMLHLRASCPCCNSQRWFIEHVQWMMTQSSSAHYSDSRQPPRNDRDQLCISAWDCWWSGIIDCCMKSLSCCRPLTDRERGVRGFQQEAKQQPVITEVRWGRDDGQARGREMRECTAQCPVFTNHPRL